MLGAFVGVPSPAVVEMVGYAGYDMVVLDAEHGTFNAESMEDCLRAGAAGNLSCLVRVAACEDRLIQLALDLGADGVQVPQVETADQARMAVECSRFPPSGRRGYGSTTRAAAYGFRPRPLVRELAERDLVVSIQIESRSGVQNLSSILETEGICVVFIGTSDLSMAYGYDSPNDPAMAPLLEELVCGITAAGRIAGLHISDWSQVEFLRKLGVRYFTVSAVGLIKDAFVRQVNDFAATVGRRR